MSCIELYGGVHTTPRTPVPLGTVTISSVSVSISVMAYVHYRTRIQIWTQTQIPNLWLHSIMQNMFPLTQTQIRIPFA